MMKSSDYSRVELQEMVFMTGSKKQLALYLGLDSKEFNALWKARGLQTPIEYLRSISVEDLLLEFVTYGSAAAMGAHFGLSASAVKTQVSLCLRKPVYPSPLMEKDILEAYCKNYRSIRLVTRIINKFNGSNYSESAVRNACLEKGVDLSSLLDWSTTNHSNAKGRRAEFDFIKLAPKKGIRILADMNVEVGSQAAYDFDTVEFGHVNVKSSKMYKFKAKTRKDDPYYWKFSMSGAERCDYFALMFYDEGMKKLLGFSLYAACEAGVGQTTFTLKGSYLGWTSVLPQESLV